MKSILAIGDAHIKTSNISDIELFLDELKNLLNKEKFDLIVVLGDTLHDHNKLDSIPLSYATKYFLLLSNHCPLFVLVGNHDYISNSQFLTDKHWLNPFKHSKYNITIVDKVIQHENLLFVPYVPDGKFNEAIRTTNLLNINLIFAHQTFNGSKMGAVHNTNVEDWKENIPIISGHLHDKQLIKTDNTFIYYTGSSMQHAYGENHDKTIIKITTSDKNINFSDITEIKLNLPVRKIKSLHISKIDKFIKKNYEKIKSGMIKYRINIECNSEEYKIFRKSKEYNKYTKLGIKFDYKATINELKLNENINKKDYINNNFFEELKSNINKDDFKDDILNLYEQISKEIGVNEIVEEGGDEGNEEGDGVEFLE
jgi:DNA repair exonuclease SbcCD nuclease subunit